MLFHNEWSFAKLEIKTNLLYFLYSAFYHQFDACTRRLILPPVFQVFTLPSLPLPSLPPLSWKAFTRIQVDCPHSMKMKSGEISVLCLQSKNFCSDLLIMLLNSGWLWSEIFASLYCAYSNLVSNILVRIPFD